MFKRLTVVLPVLFTIFSVSLLLGGTSNLSTVNKNSAPFAAPTFTSTSPTATVVYDRPFTYNFSATDGDLDAISFYTVGAQQLDANFISGYYWSTGTQSLTWQSFTAVNTGLLVSAGHYANFATSSSGGTITFSFYSGEGTGGSLLYTSTFHMSNAPGYNMNTIPNGTNIVLTAGQKYTIAYSGSGFGGLYPNVSNPYTDGRSSYSSNADFPFQVNIKPLTTTPTATWLSLTDNGDGTGSLTGTPTVSNAGAFSETLVAKAGTDYISQAISFTIAGPQVTVAKLRAVAKNGEVGLKWMKNNDSNNFSKYYIYSGTTPNPTAITDSTEAGNINDTSKTFTGLTNGTTYYFRIKAKTTDGYLSEYSPEKGAVPANKPGSALSFNGSNQTVTASSPTWATGGPITIEYWNYVASGDVKSSSAFDFGLNSTHRIQAHSPWSDGNLYWDYGTVPSGRLSVNYSPYLNKWTHIALVSAGNGGSFMGIYINGILVVSGISSDGPDVALTGLTIGGGNGGFHKGKIDEFRIWNKVRSQAEIQSSMLSAIRGDEDNLVAAYHFDEQSGNKAFNATLNDFNGTLNNAPATSVSAAMSISSPTSLYGFSGNESAELKWTGTLGAVKYRIFGGETSNPTELVDSTTQTTLTISGLTNGTQYFYRVAAVDADGFASGYSNEDAVVPNNGPGNAVSLDGTNDYVNLGTALTHPANFTYEFWFKPSVSGVDRILFSKEQANTAANQFRCGVTASDKIYFLMTNNSVQDGGLYTSDYNFMSANPVSTTNWSHIAITKNGTELNMYINGILEDTFTLSVNLASSNAKELRIGSGTFSDGTSATGAVAGNFDEFRIWSSAKTMTEIAENMFTVSHGDEGGLVTALHFDESTGSTSYDATQNGYNGNLVNGASFVPSDALSAASLPVELTSFSFSGNNLLWSTATETNNAGWEVESRLFDSAQSDSHPELVEGFHKIGFVAGKGTTTEKQKYIFSVSSLQPSVSAFEVRLKQIDSDGKFTYSKILTVDFTPTEFGLSQNYPNPFNPVTSINYHLKTNSFVSLKVYDLLGREVKVLVNEDKPSGSYSLNFSAVDLPSGVYFYKLTAGNFSETKKMTVMK